MEFLNTSNSRGLDLVAYMDGFQELRGIAFFPALGAVLLQLGYVQQSVGLGEFPEIVLDEDRHGLLVKDPRGGVRPHHHRLNVEAPAGPGLKDRLHGLGPGHGLIIGSLAGAWPSTRILLPS